MMPLNINGQYTHFYHMSKMVEYLINVASKNDTLATKWMLTPEERTYLNDTYLNLHMYNNYGPANLSSVLTFQAVDTCHNNTAIDLMSGLSLDTEAITTASLTSAYNIPTLAWGSTANSLADKSLYPTFSRTYPSSNNQVPLMINFAISQNWYHVGLLFTDDSYGMEMAQEFTSLASTRGITVLQGQTFRSSGSLAERQDSMKKALTLLKLSGARIIFFFAFVKDSIQETLTDPAKEVGMYGLPYVYIGSGGVCTLTPRKTDYPGMLCLYPYLDSRLPAFQRFYYRTRLWFTSKGLPMPDIGQTITNYETIFFAAKARTIFNKAVDSLGISRHGTQANTLFTLFIRNTTMDGPTGLVKLDSKGERPYPYFLINRPTDEVLATATPIVLDLIPVAVFPITSETAKPIILRPITYPNNTFETPLDRLVQTLCQEGKEPIDKSVNAIILIISLALSFLCAWVFLLMFDNIIIHEKRKWWLYALTSLPLSILISSSSSFSLTSLSFSWNAVGYNPLFFFISFILIWPLNTLIIYTSLLSVRNSDKVEKLITSKTSKDSSTTTSSKEIIKLDIEENKASKRYLNFSLLAFPLIPLILNIIISLSLEVSNTVNVSLKEGWYTFRLLWLLAIPLASLSLYAHVNLQASRWRSTFSFLLGFSIWLFTLASTLSSSVSCQSTLTVDILELDNQKKIVSNGIPNTFNSLIMQIIIISLSAFVSIILLMFNNARLKMSKEHLDLKLMETKDLLCKNKKELSNLQAKAFNMQVLLESVVAIRYNKDFMNSLWLKFKNEITPNTPLFFTQGETNGTHLDFLLFNPVGLEILKDIMCKRHTEENLFFLLDVLIYENRVPVSQRQLYAKYICETYIKDGGNRQVNLQGNMSGKIIEAVNNDATKDVFVPAVNEVKKLIALNDMKELLMNDEMRKFILTWKDLQFKEETMVKVNEE